MKKSLPFIILIVVILLTAGLIPAKALQPGEQALVKITVQSEAAGVPVYARLHSQDESYLLAGATPDKLSALEATVLDSDMRGGSYYLAYLMPNQSRPDWNAYGRLLLDDGVQALLRISPQDAERLAQTGVELRALTLDPKPLRPAVVEEEFPPVTDPDPLIQAMMDQIDSVAVTAYTGDLSGEWPVEIGGEPYTIVTRHTDSGEPVQKATQFVGEHLDALGLEMEYHVWDPGRPPNVIGELTGEINPDQIFIICAHVDDMPSGPVAPGADDNASGSVAVLLAADVLTQYQWGSTLRFALWTGEEQGLLGSQVYAQRAASNGENIVGVLNLDMIAWNTTGSSPNVDLHADLDLPATLELANLFADVVEVYDLDLVPQIVPNGIGASDHASFWNYNYTAILGIEDLDDFNPYYHTTNDLLEHLDKDYHTEFVKASVGVFALMSDSLLSTGFGYLDGHVTTADGGVPIPEAQIAIRDPAGHTFTALSDDAGYYTRTLLANTYTVTASAYGYLPATITGVVVVTDTVTTQDFALETAPTWVVSGAVTEVGTGAPLLAGVTVLDTPQPLVWTDPATGFYSLTLPEGNYTFRVTAASHRPEEREVAADHNQTQDFSLELLPCVLLVDDDQNNPDVRSYYISALDAIEVGYDVWDLSSAGDPAAEDLLGYHTVLWFTGYPWSNVFNSGNETVVAAYLDAGGHFFLSSQEYLYDAGSTPFGEDYLHIGFYSNDVGQTIVTGANLYAGMGPYSLSYPFTNWSDVVSHDGQGMVAFVGDQGNAGIAYEGDFHTVFLGLPLEAIPTVDGRADIISATLAFFGGCEPHPQYGQLTGLVTDALSGEPLTGAEVVVDSTQVTADSNGYYTVTLPAGTFDVTAQADDYYSQTVSGVEVLAGQVTTQNFSLQPLSPFDFDGDCDVDIADIMAVAVRWQCEVGDPCYDPRYDVDDDGDVDVIDIMETAAWWGWRCEK